jgi:phage N-6-adenine-methyltransferase
VVSAEALQSKVRRHDGSIVSNRHDNADFDDFPNSHSETLAGPDTDLPFNHRAQGTGDNEWYTPVKYLDLVRIVFGGEIDLDPASTEFANKTVQAKRIFTVEDDGLSQEWGGKVWLNPPYGKAISKFVAKANLESTKGITVVCLVPARTDTRWWWDSCIHHEIRFIKGRIKFSGAGPAPFPSAVVVMKPKE